MRSSVLAAVVCLSLGLAISAFAQTSADLTPRARAAAEAIVAKVTALEEQQRDMPPPRDLAEELARRIVVEQAIRDISWREGLTVEEWRAASDAVWYPKMKAIDEANTAWLKSKLPADGWFRISRDGRSVANDAFLIVQHSPDRDWQLEILRRMEPLLSGGDASPQSYALLYDRVHLFRDGKQRFGTQAVCRDGKMAYGPMDEPEKVQERRDAIGFTRPTHADYGRMVGIGQDC